MTVNIKTLPVSYHKIRRIFWPNHPPIFGPAEPTAAEIALALTLIEALDPMSKLWYGRSLERLKKLTMEKEQ